MTTPVVYLVTAGGGQWEERREWNVCAFKDRSSAEGYVYICQQDAAAARGRYAEAMKKWDDDPEAIELPEVASPSDPQLTRHYVDDVTYGVEEVPLR